MAGLIIFILIFMHIFLLFLSLRKKKIPVVYVAAAVRFRFSAQPVKPDTQLKVASKCEIEREGGRRREGVR